MSDGDVPIISPGTPLAPNADRNWQGPPQASPFDNLTEKQKKHFDTALRIADGIQMYHRTGGAGVAGQFRPLAEQLEARGGLSEEEAQFLGRYRMWRQGLPVVPSNPEPPDTQETIASERDKLFAARDAGDWATVARIVDQGNTREYNRQQNFFSGLVKPKKHEEAKVDEPETPDPQQPPPAAIPAETMAAQNSVLAAQKPPDMQLPPESYDPKTGLDYDTVYPDKQGGLPPDIDPETGLDFNKRYEPGGM